MLITSPVPFYFLLWVVGTCQLPVWPLVLWDSSVRDGYGSHTSTQPSFLMPICSMVFHVMTVVRTLLNTHVTESALGDGTKEALGLEKFRLKPRPHPPTGCTI